jgi:transposase InsO family protein
MGVYQWLRVPMGLKNAASYFQRVMATVVLAGLLYVMCELYIDDVILFGSSDDEFVSNLKEILLRLRKHKIVINPKKCSFGMDHIECVGHTLSAKGVTFSSEKREKVLTFPKPVRMKEMLQFLGLVNYFRDHVSDMTERMKPLRELVKNYDKRKVLQWTAESETAFFSARDEIGSCPALFFVDESAPIIVMTDASDYGIGTYVYQLIDNKEHPIIFISKSLQGAQLNWSTVEKEAYAIFYALTKNMHLLRDQKFVLQTDHKNLTYINMEGSPKVKRWKLAIQEFDFDLEHIAGVKNPIADAFSRLCANEGKLKDSEGGFLCNFGDPKVRIPDDHYRAIGRVHNSTVGHFGVERTIARLHKSNQVWKHLRAHVRQYVRQCPHCQKMSALRLAIKTHPFTTASYDPMEVLNIDAIGPLKEDEFGNSHILVVVDCFTRWVELYPVPDVSARHCATALLQHVGRYGVPATVRSDRGSQFVNEILAELSSVLGTEQEFTTAYSKEENAIVERMNKEVMRHLRAILFDKKVLSRWSMDQLPLVMRILNSEEKTRTGVSPCELLFGNSINLNRRLLREPVVVDKTAPIRRLSDHMENLLTQQANLIEVAQKTQAQYDSHHMSVFDPEFTEFPINSYVLMEHPAGPPHKLKMQKRGPFQVINSTGTKYTVQDLVTGKMSDTHISNLSPFLYDPNHVDPLDIAMKDQEEFFIDSIVSHRGNKSRRKTMEFLVHWRGYGHDSDSWEPYSSLRDTDQLILYLRNNRLRSLIGGKHKD